MFRALYLKKKNRRELNLSLAMTILNSAMFLGAYPILYWHNCNTRTLNDIGKFLLSPNVSMVVPTEHYIVCPLSLILKGHHIWTKKT